MVKREFYNRLLNIIQTDQAKNANRIRALDFSRMVCYDYHSETTKKGIKTIWTTS